MDVFVSPPIFIGDDVLGTFTATLGGVYASDRRPKQFLHTLEPPSSFNFGMFVLYGEHVPQTSEPQALR